LTILTYDNFKLQVTLQQPSDNANSRQRNYRLRYTESTTGIMYIREILDKTSSETEANVPYYRHFRFM